MNDAMRRLESMVGEWDVTMTHAWFLDSLEAEILGTATVEWFADGFLMLRSTFEDRDASAGGSAWALAIGRNDARDAFVALSYDNRDVIGCST